MSNSNSGNVTISFGGLIWFFMGFICSILINKSIFWAIIHGLCGPFYILYLCFGCGGGFDSVDTAIHKFLDDPPAQHEESAP